MILSQAYLYFSKLLTLKDINPNLEAKILLQFVCNLSDTDFILKKNTFTLNNSQYKKLQQLICKRNTGYPLAYILQYKYFWKHKFIVNDDVLIPRPESELIVENSLQLFPNAKQNINILDIGVGSGCLLLSLLLEYPNATGIGLDISQPALQTTQNNAIQLKINKSNLTLIKSNILEDLPSDLTFDLIVSNPPYIDVNDPLVEKYVKQYEPSIALFAPNKGLLFYEKIFMQLNNRLNHGGFAILEFGINQLQDIQNLAKFYNLNIHKVINDLNNIPRLIILNTKTSNK